MIALYISENKTEIYNTSEKFMTKTWTPNEIISLYRIEKAKTSIYRDETNHIIPSAKRVMRGKSFVRIWENADLPAIGSHYGFLKAPSETKVISVYTPKGGVLKSTFSFNLARMLALNGIKTLVIGLDVQCTVTHNLKQENIEIESLENIQNIFGLYEASKNSELSKAILPTDLPTLFYIPESSNLNHLEQNIRDKPRRENTIAKLIEPLKKEFQVIIFDNSPNWNFLIQNSLVAATDVISPIACDIETFRSLTQNIQMVNDFKLALDLAWSNFILIPTKLERTKLSTQIEAQYRTLFPDIITSSSIRSAAKGQESSLEKLSVIEYDSKSQLAQDYYEVITDVWNRINPKPVQPIKTKASQKNTDDLGVGV